MSTLGLQKALQRVADWERSRTHVSRVPKPITEDEHLRQQSFEDRAAAAITNLAGSMRFVYLHRACFALWIVINAGLLVAAGFGVLAPFDPFPFGLLTLVVSLEAIFLSTFVMIAQNRQADIADRRAQADYDVNVR